MKTRTVVLLITFVMLGTGLHAQFWKKLGQRAADAAEETVMRKVEDKTMEKTEKTMDTILNADQKLKKKKQRTSNENDETVYQEDEEYQDEEQMPDGPRDQCKC